jgi:tetratricopeptide (TPR) repeat protein
MSKLNKITTIISNMLKGKKTLKSSRVMQNFLIVWLDASIDDENDSDCHHTITQLRQVVNTINIFTDADQCITFISDIKEEKIFMIISGSIGQDIVPVIHDMSQIDSIYVFCKNKLRHKEWAEKWSKIKGVFIEIPPICKALTQAAQQCDQNAISMSFVSTTEGFSNQINQSFMYTQILKEILLTINFDEQSIKDFIVYCREQFTDNSAELHNIDKLEREYHHHTPIWWYTYECFLYSMLNRALRTMEVDTIIKTGFFVRDLHNHIKQLHSEQHDGHRKYYSFTVYRGQGLSRTDFDQIMKTKGGLLSFNNFLSTSKKQNVSLNFARRSLLNPDSIGILFVMNIDSSISSTPFASIKNISYYETEREILFSMHSVFRIGHIKQIDYGNDRLWKVELTLTSDDDPQRSELTTWMREKTQGWIGWHRLGQLLVILGQFTKAEDLYKVLLDQAIDEGEKAHYNHYLGVIKDSQGEYQMAITFYEESLEINRKILRADHPNLGSSYSGIGLIYSKIGDYSKALSSHEKALDIFRKTFSSINPQVAITYGNIGKVYHEMGEYTKALSSHEKALEIFQKTLPEIHPYVGTCYCDIGKVYGTMNEYSKALSSHQKALEIREKTLSPNHPLLAASFSNIGEIYIKMREYSKGIPFIERAVELGQRSLPANHPDLELYRKSLLSFQTRL